MRRLNLMSRLFPGIKRGIAFYKEDGKWYADVKQHTKEDNEMIDGSDEFLELLAINYARNPNRVIMSLSLKYPRNPKFLLTRISHDDDGATYRIRSINKQIDGNYDEECWLCNVVHTVFGEHPATIFISDIY